MSRRCIISSPSTYLTSRQKLIPKILCTFWASDPSRTVLDQGPPPAVGAVLAQTKLALVCILTTTTSGLVVGLFPGYPLPSFLCSTLPGCFSVVGSGSETGGTNRKHRHTSARFRDDTDMRCSHRALGERSHPALTQ